MEKSNIEQVDCWSLGVSSSCHHTSGQPFLSNKQVNKQTNKHTNKEIQSLGFGTAPFQKIKKPTNMIGRQCCHENLGIIVHCTVLYSLYNAEQDRKRCIGVDRKRIVSYWQCWLLLPAPGVWTDSVDPNFSPCVFLQREQERETWQIVFRHKKFKILDTLHCRKKIFGSSSGKLHHLFFCFWILQSQ